MRSRDLTVAETTELQGQVNLPEAVITLDQAMGRALSRGSIYERVRAWGQRSRVGFPLSPHRLRHTFATHLVRAGVGLVTIRDLLGHRLITSTQIYLHVTVDDLRAAVARHPISTLLNTVKHLFAPGPLPFQKARAIYCSG